MSRGVYTLLLRLLAPLLWCWLGTRARRVGGSWDIFGAERFGGGHALPELSAPVWVHAVSLGETRASEPLVRALLRRGLPVLLTHTTATGREEGARLFAGAIDAGQLRQAWLPYDFPGATRRFFARHAPRAGLLIEREIWPNLLAAARGANVPVALVSARFSESSLRQARWMGACLRGALCGLDAVLAQTARDAERLRLAGAKHVAVTGNLKFDLHRDSGQIDAGRAWRQAVGRPVVAIASTREGEDTLFAQAIARLHAQGGGDSAAPDTLYLLIPRHPQRFEAAAQSARDAGLTITRRSASSAPPDPQIRVQIGDTLGEMPFNYGASDVAIIGGSFAPLGGQNLIEASAADIPVIVGPHTFHFEQAVRDAVSAGAALRVADPDQALAAAQDLLADGAKRQAMRSAARVFIDAHTGATQRTLDALKRWL